MKRGQLIALGLAGACGLGALVIARNFTQTPVKKAEPERPRLEIVQVLVARSDIGLGQIASDASFRWQDWPRTAVSKSFITQQGRPQAMRDYTGAIARSPIMAGEPITDNKLIKANSGGVLAAILPPGMRAISTKIKDETAAGKLILPNDHVDVILIRRNRGRGGEEYVADTLFRNVRVLAIGQQIEAKDGKKNAEGSTATLELTPRQSELLALANSMGDITLALRSVADLDGDKSGELALDRSRNASSIRVLRYGVKTRQYGVN